MNSNNFWYLILGLALLCIIVHACNKDNNNVKIPIGYPPLPEKEDTFSSSPPKTPSKFKARKGSRDELSDANLYPFAPSYRFAIVKIKEK